MTPRAGFVMDFRGAFVIGLLIALGCSSSELTGRTARGAAGAGDANGLAGSATGTGGANGLAGRADSSALGQWGPYGAPEITAPDCLDGVICDTPWVHDTIEDDSCHIPDSSCSWHEKRLSLVLPTGTTRADVLALSESEDGLFVARASQTWAWHGVDYGYDGQLRAVSFDDGKIRMLRYTWDEHEGLEYLRETESGWSSTQFDRDTPCRLMSVALYPTARVYCGTAAKEFKVLELTDGVLVERALGPDDELILAQAVRDSDTGLYDAVVQRWEGEDWQTEHVMTADTPYFGAAGAPGVDESGIPMDVKLIGTAPLSLLISGWNANTPKRVKIAVRVDEGWKLVTPPFDDPISEAAVGANGKIHLLTYREGRLLYAEESDTDWRLHEVAFSAPSGSPSTPEEPRGAGLLVDAERTVYIGYYGVSRFALGPGHHFGLVRYNPSSAVELAPFNPEPTYVVPGDVQYDLPCNAIELGTEVDELPVYTDEWSLDDCALGWVGTTMVKGERGAPGRLACVSAEPSNPPRIECDGWYSCFVRVDEGRVTAVEESCVS